MNGSEFLMLDLRVVWIVVVWDSSALVAKLSPYIVHVVSDLLHHLKQGDCKDSTSVHCSARYEAAIVLSLYVRLHSVHGRDRDIHAGVHHE